MKTHISHLPRHLALSQCLGQDSEIMGHVDPLLAKTWGHLQNNLDLLMGMFLGSEVAQW